MRKFLLSIMMLTGVGLGFAKGLPVNQERKLDAEFVSKTPVKVETFRFDTKEEMEKFLEARCFYYLRRDKNYFC
ncbi:hypothetical protein [Bergeyella zoohelcum]|uniref:Uncharacterized protein n=2 Tax=Bergeyella zoohelcum TaxID=1015 RepID=K1LWI2_9FLAO|nr:hypothetical protein [Bergeyella zoohelcum]EKB59301.1 hypothetical protein HMPREF9699_00237 [Bergeyella zoohelcum ATCC 43767]SUV49588.1 Uncharacterised protein [Bergeyella zoohelcum]